MEIFLHPLPGFRGQRLPGSGRRGRPPADQEEMVSRFMASDWKIDALPEASLDGAGSNELRDRPVKTPIHQSGKAAERTFVLIKSDDQAGDLACEKSVVGVVGEGVQGSHLLLFYPGLQGLRKLSGASGKYLQEWPFKRRV